MCSDVTTVFFSACTCSTCEVCLSETAWPSLRVEPRFEPITCSEKEVIEPVAASWPAPRRPFQRPFISPVREVATTSLLACFFSRSYSDACFLLFCVLFDMICKITPVLYHRL